MNDKENHERTSHEWDAAFQRLIENEELNDTSLDNEISSSLSSPQEGSGDSQAKASLPQQRCMSIILTAVRDPEDLVAILACEGIEKNIIPTDTGCLIYDEYPLDDTCGFEELLGDERPLPPEAIDLAQNLSRAMDHYGTVLCVSWLRQEPDETSQLCGQVVAKRYVKGKFDTNLPAGQLISLGSPILEDILLGLVDPADHIYQPEHSHMSRFEALRHLHQRMKEERQSRHNNE